MLESFEKNKKGILIMMASAVCACVGQMLWKMSAELGIFVALCGFAFYGLGALFMLIAYKYGKLSVLQPMQSVNYVISIVLGTIVFKEAVTAGKIIGVIIIMTGIVLISGGDEE